MITIKVLGIAKTGKGEVKVIEYDKDRFGANAEFAVKVAGVTAFSSIIEEEAWDEFFEIINKNPATEIKFF